MGKLLSYLCICSVFFAVSYSLRNNNTSVKKSFTGEGVAQVFTGRQTSVFATDIYNTLKKQFLQYGTVKFVVWNRTPDELTDAKWNAENLVVEAPAPLFVEREKEPVVISTYYEKYLTKNPVRSLWVSYSKSEASSDRICIRGKIETTRSKWLVWKSTTFKYAVYRSSNEDCSNENLVFENNVGENGYHTIDSDGIKAKCAFESHGLDFVLNVYIFQVLRMLNPEIIEVKSKVRQLHEKKGNFIPSVKQYSHVVEDDVVQPRLSQPKKNRKRNVVKKIQSMMKVRGKKQKVSS